MPSGEPNSPRGIPAEQNLFTIYRNRGGREFPQRKIGRVAFVLYPSNAHSRLKALKINAAEFPVAREFGCIEIHTVCRFVRVTLFLERFCHRDLSAKGIACAWKLNVRSVDVEFANVFNKNARVFVRERAHVRKGELHLLSLEAERHFVLAGVGIG